MEGEAARANSCDPDRRPGLTGIAADRATQDSRGPGITANRVCACLVARKVQSGARSRGVGDLVVTMSDISPESADGRAPLLLEPHTAHWKAGP